MRILCKLGLHRWSYGSWDLMSDLDTVRICDRCHKAQFQDWVFNEWSDLGEDFQGPQDPLSGRPAAQ